MRISMPTLLLVEDNEMNGQMLARRLSRRGFAVTIATDGRQAVDEARRQPPALILMDLRLPVLDGWEATRQLKSDAGTRAIPIIALTAHAMSEDRQRALDAGCDEYETKPIDLPRLLTKIDLLLKDPSCTE
jgi:CheY-like chemotaxis protein